MKEKLWTVVTPCAQPNCIAVASESFEDAMVIALEHFECCANHLELEPADSFDGVAMILRRAK